MKLCFPMTPTFRTRMLFLTGFAALLLMVCTSPEAFSSILTDSQVCESMEELQDTDQQLDELKRNFQERMLIKEDMIDQLIAGQVSLLWVSQQFLDMNLATPSAISTIERSYPGTTLLEKSAENVIDYTRIKLIHSKEKNQKAILKRLRSELNFQFHSSSSH